MVGSTSNSSNMHGVVDDNSNPYRNMVMDVMIINHDYTSECPVGLRGNFFFHFLLFLLRGKQYTIINW
jgi:hypothetical protein